jgi:hypothetical protein
MDSRSITNPRRLRAKLVLHGVTIRGFAEKHGFNERTVKAAVRGERRGPKSRAIVAKVEAL